MAKKAVSKPAAKAAAADVKKVGLSKKKPVNEAIPLGTPPEKVEQIKAQRRKAEKEPVGERTATLSEERRREKARSIAAALLMERDGLDAETALVVVESMDPDDIQALVTEAATTVIEKTAEQIATAAAPAEEKGADLAPAEAKEDKVPYIDFTEVKELLESETFAVTVMEVRDLSKTKNTAEAEYKARKKDLIAELDKVGHTHVQFSDIKVRRYKGGSKFLDARKLLAKGVSIDVINQCYSTTEYDDVALYGPKEE